MTESEAMEALLETYTEDQITDEMVEAMMAIDSNGA